MIVFYDAVLDTSGTVTRRAFSTAFSRTRTLFGSTGAATAFVPPAVLAFANTTVAAAFSCVVIALALMTHVLFSSFSSITEINS